MRLNVSAWSIRRPVPSIILFLILSALGIMAFRGLPVERFPNIDFPLISVTVTQAGASPSELETQVSRRVEDAEPVLFLHVAGQALRHGISEPQSKVPVPDAGGEGDVGSRREAHAGHGDSLQPRRRAEPSAHGRERVLRAVVRVVGRHRHQLKEPAEIAASVPDD